MAVLRFVVKPQGMAAVLPVIPEGMGNGVCAADPSAPQEPR